jgi:hypothetical protein
MRTSALSTVEESPPEDAPGAFTAIENPRRLLYRSAVKYFFPASDIYSLPKNFPKRRESAKAFQCISIPENINIPLVLSEGTVY